MDENDRSNPQERIVDDLLERLRSEGVPAGMWLVDIARVRQSLQDADSLLRRLAEAILENLGPPA